MSVFSRCILPTELLRNLLLAASILLLVSILGISQSFAQEPELVANINTYPNTAYRGSSIVYNGKIYLSHEDATNGSELFVLEDENATPQLVKDISPGAESSNPQNFAIANGLLFFRASTPAEGSELWVSDGTGPGTNLVVDLMTGAENSFPNQITPFFNESRIGFRAESDIFGSEFGEEICVSDGTAVGTICYDLRPGTPDSRPEDLTAVGIALVFAANDGTNGQEPWAILGGAAPLLVFDINPGSSGSNCNGFTPFNGGVLFQARDGAVNGNELWFSTGPGTSTMVRDIDPVGSSNPGGFTVVSPTLALFSARTALGFELWKTDGTNLGTTLVKDIHTGSNGSAPNSLRLFGSEVLFTADDGTNGRELWKSDGTLAGTVLVEDIEPGPNGSSINHLNVIGGKGIFTARTSLFGDEPWITDGTAAGTQVLQDMMTGEPGSFTRDIQEFNGRAFFFANEQSGPGAFFLNATNDAIEDTVPLIGVGDQSSLIFSLFPISDQYLFFHNWEALTGSEPWVYDIVNGTASLLADIMPGSNDSSPTFIGAINGIGIFSATDLVNGRELWVTNGTSAGTGLLIDFIPGVADSNPNPLAYGGFIFNGFAYFGATTSTEGNELWKTDGTVAGTTLVKDIFPGVGNGQPQSAVAALGEFFFTADDGVNGRELWKSDGTTAGTVFVKDINPGGSAVIGAIHEHDNRIFFRADDGATGNELWMSDGTTAGTEIAADIDPGATGSNPGNLFSLGNKLLFSARIPVEFEVLMSIEAPYNAGTVTNIKDPVPGGLTAAIGNMTDVFGTTLFTAVVPGTGIDLWSTDGTTAGTNPFLIISPEPSSSAEISGFYKAGDYYYFGADDGVVGNEIWRTDGTVAGTVLHKDLDPGTRESNPFYFPAHRGVLYFTARTKQYGDELWRIVFDECPDDDDKTVPGQCGCGVADVDTDSDGTLDCFEECPADPAKLLPGQCGCGVSDVDGDGDGSPDCSDNCPADPAKLVVGECGCGVPDADLNANSVSDCLVNADFTKIVDDSIELVKLLGKKAKKLKALGLTKKEIKRRVKALASQISGYQNAGLSISADEKVFDKRKKQASKLMRKATRLRSSLFKGNKKKALRKLRKLRKLLS